LFILVLICFLSINTQAAMKSYEYLFQEGNRLYQQGEYEKALEKYNEIIKMNYESAELFYNIGNCYYKIGKNAKAILYYEKALKLKPNDEDANFNLQIANMRIIDKVQSIPELFYIAYFKKLCSYFTVWQLGIIELVLYLILVLAAIIFLLSKSGRVKRIVKIIGVVGGFLVIIFSSIFIYKIYLLEHDIKGVVMEVEVMVRSAPDESAIELFTVHEGLKVEVVNKSEGWYEVKLPDGKEGWLKASSIEII
jgi:tetratricopeptide (TPR) repeat protein